MQQQQSQNHSLKLGGIFQETFDNLLDIGNGPEDIHTILDDIYLCYLQDSLACPSDDDPNYFFLYSELQRLIRYPKNPDSVQRTLKGILEVSTSEEDVYGMLDSFFAAYVRDSKECTPDRGSMAEHFYLYTNVKKLLRLFENGENDKV